MSVKALIFDFDGIITDTEPVHMDAWQGVLEPLGIFIDEEEFRSDFLGLNDRDFIDAVSKVRRRHLSDIERAELIERKTVAVVAMLEHDIPLLPGVADFVEGAGEIYPLAICSGSNRCEIEFILKHLKWTDRFDPVVASDSVVRGKPDPEGYIRAYEGLAERFDGPLSSTEVMAVEDSPRGIAAAKAAGLRCLAVKNSFDEGALKEADIIVASLADIDPAALRSQKLI